MVSKRNKKGGSIQFIKKPRSRARVASGRLKALIKNHWGNPRKIGRGKDMREISATCTTLAPTRRRQIKIAHRLPHEVGRGNSCWHYETCEKIPWPRFEILFQTWQSQEKCCNHFNWSHTLGGGAFRVIRCHQNHGFWPIPGPCSLPASSIPPFLSRTHCLSISRFIWPHTRNNFPYGRQFVCHAHIHLWPGLAGISTIVSPPARVRLFFKWNLCSSYIVSNDDFHDEHRTPQRALLSCSFVST